MNGCPYEELDTGTVLIMEAANLASEGTLPAPGGMLSQTQWFMEAWRFYRSEESQWKVAGNG